MYVVPTHAIKLVIALLTYCGILTPYWHQHWSTLVNIGSSNGLLCDGTCFNLEQVWLIIINARFTPNCDQLRTDLQIGKFWISWNHEQSLNFYHQIASSCLHRCRGGTEIGVKIKCIIGQVIRVTCEHTMTELWARDPRMPFVSLSAKTWAPEPQPQPDRCDTLWFFVTDKGPTYDLGMTASRYMYLYHSTKICMR